MKIKITNQIQINKYNKMMIKQIYKKILSLIIINKISKILKEIIIIQQSLQLILLTIKIVK
jgi:hypothetical protein